MEERRLAEHVARDQVQLDVRDLRVGVVAHALEPGPDGLVHRVVQHDDRLPDRARVSRSCTSWQTPSAEWSPSTSAKSTLRPSSASRSRSCGSSAWLSPVWKVTLGSRRASGCGSDEVEGVHLAAVRGDPRQASALGGADLDRELPAGAGRAVPRAPRARRMTSASRSRAAVWMLASTVPAGRLEVSAGIRPVCTSHTLSGGRRHRLGNRCGPGVVETTRWRTGHPMTRSSWRARSAVSPMPTRSL